MNKGAVVLIWSYLVLVRIFSDHIKDAQKNIK